ncbi:MULTISPECIES: hypothetical protein [Rhodomicrobium]|uniref:hypothetical protein n=1 Tax=Rhodomicrobium TaxID=1068 RepID=UPI000B4A658C|nr:MULTISPECIES: hypothetical protein [Rhodomicrobium]
MAAENPVYLLLDRIRETQLRQTVMLEELTRSMKTSSTASGAAVSPMSGWLPLLKPIGALTAQYATGLLVMSYVLKGGDAMTAAEVLLRLL